MKLKNLFLVIFAICALTPSLYADIVSTNPRPRLLGMGGAGLATIGDYDSAMVNPAGLADIKKNHLEVLPLLIEVPLELTVLSDYMDYKDSADGTDQATKKAKLKALLGDVANSALGTRVNLYPNYTMGHFHFGILADTVVNPRLRAGGLGSNQVVEMGGSNLTAGLMLAYGRNYLDDRLQVGVTVKPLYRTAATVHQTQTLYDIVKGMDPGTDIGDQMFGQEKGDLQAVGVGLDLGAKYYIPYLEFIKPSVGLTYQDIGDTRFWTDGDRPESIEQSLSAGLAIHPAWHIVSTAFALDFRNINAQEDWMNKIHFGAEAKIWKILAVRAGLSQMYWTVGLGLNFWLMQLDTYIAAQEVGKFAHMQEQRTVGLKLSFGI